MACPKCGKRVPQRYRGSHAAMHLDEKGDVKYMPMSVDSHMKHHKNLWEALKHAVRVAEENKNEPKRKYR